MRGNYQGNPLNKAFVLNRHKEFMGHHALLGERGLYGQFTGNYRPYNVSKQTVTSYMCRSTREVW